MAESSAPELIQLSPQETEKRLREVRSHPIDYFFSIPDTFGPFWETSVFPFFFELVFSGRAQQISMF